MTAIASALREAGYLSPDEKLYAIALEAWTKWSAREAGGARRDYVIGHLRGELTWALLSHWQAPMLTQAIGWLLNRVKQDIEEQQPAKDAGKPAGGGQSQVETHCPRAPATPSGAKPDGDRGQTSAETHTTSASVATSSDAGATRRSEPADLLLEPTSTVPAAPIYDHHAATVAAKIDVARRLSRLDTVSVNGQPIGKVTAGEARGWARSHGTQARFITLLVSNMPDEWVIGDHVPPGLADELYARAETEYAAAA